MRYNCETYYSTNKNDLILNKTDSLTYLALHITSQVKQILKGVNYLYKGNTLNCMSSKVEIYCENLLKLSFQLIITDFQYDEHKFS